MLDVNFEFRRGILFIRLCGELTKRTIKEFDLVVTSLIRDNGIRMPSVLQYSRTI